MDTQPGKALLNADNPISAGAMGMRGQTAAAPPAPNKVGAIIQGIQSLNAAVEALGILRHELRGDVPEQPVTATPPDRLLSQGGNGGISVGIMLSDLPGFLLGQAESITNETQLIREMLI